MTEEQVRRVNEGNNKSMEVGARAWGVANTQNHTQTTRKQPTNSPRNTLGHPLSLHPTPPPIRKQPKRSGDRSVPLLVGHATRPHRPALERGNSPGVITRADLHNRSPSPESPTEGRWYCPENMLLLGNSGCTLLTDRLSTINLYNTTDERGLHGPK